MLCDGDDIYVMQDLDNLGCHRVVFRGDNEFSIHALLRVVKFVVPSLTCMYRGLVETTLRKKCEGTPFSFGTVR